MNKPALVVVPGLGSGATAAPNDEKRKLPRPVKPLTDAEKPVWRHVVQALDEHGLANRTAVLTLHVIVTTFTRWADAEKRLQDLLDAKGTYFVSTPNGYEQPHQMYYVARDLKRELLKWLPEAALTVVSFKKLTETPEQGDLFGTDPLAMHIANKPRLVQVS